MTETQPTVPFFKKKSRSRPTNQRQRDNSPSASSSNAGPSTLSSRSATKSEVVLPTRRGNSSLLSAGTKRSAAQRDNNKFDEDEDEDDVKETEEELDGRMKEFEELMDRRPFLVNDVLLRRNPNDVQEWEKRVALWGENDEKVRVSFSLPEKKPCP